MNAAELHLPHHLGVPHGPGVRHGESDPAAMLGRVLLLLAAITMLGVFELVWWLV